MDVDLSVIFISPSPKIRPGEGARNEFQLYRLRWVVGFTASVGKLVPFWPPIGYAILIFDQANRVIPSQCPSDINFYSIRCSNLLSALILCLPLNLDETNRTSHVVCVHSLIGQLQRIRSFSQIVSHIVGLCINF